jgi:hypothetical protein
MLFFVEPHKLIISKDDKKAEYLTGSGTSDYIKAVVDFVQNNDPTPLSGTIQYIDRSPSLSINRSESITVQMFLLDRGCYYPRIYRPIEIVAPHDNNFHYDKDALWSSSMQLQILLNRLGQVFGSVYPDPANMSTYGHEIRDIILLSCMEFESHCKNILRANSYNFRRGSANADLSDTRDYFKLLGPLRLMDYEMSLMAFPSLLPMSPFATWNGSAPTRSLPWYDCYNSIKHDREVNFSSAKLHYAIESVLACCIMIAAQYDIYPVIERTSNIVGPLKFNKRPKWNILDCYIAPPQGVAWSAQNLQL